MKSFMVDSQLELLEEPVDENDVILVDSSQEKEKVLDVVVETVQSQILNA